MNKTGPKFNNACQFKNNGNDQGQKYGSKDDALPKSLSPDSRAVDNSFVNKMPPVTGYNQNIARSFDDLTLGQNINHVNQTNLMTPPDLRTMEDKRIKREEAGHYLPRWEKAGISNYDRLTYFGEECTDKQAERLLGLFSIYKFSSDKGIPVGPIAVKLIRKKFQNDELLIENLCKVCNRNNENDWCSLHSSRLIKILGKVPVHEMQYRPTRGDNDSQYNSPLLGKRLNRGQTPPICRDRILTDWPRISLSKFAVSDPGYPGQGGG